MTSTIPSGTFYCAPKAALRLPSCQHHVLSALCLFPETWASYATIAKWCGLSRSTVIRAMAALIERGLVECEAGGGRNGTNRYRLSAKAWDAPAGVKSTPPSCVKSTPPQCQIDTPAGVKLRPNKDQGIKTNKRTPLTPQGGGQTGVGSIQKKTNSPEQEKLLRENPQLKKTYDALRSRSMKRNLESFLAIVAVTGDASPAVVNRALLNLESSDRHTLTAETWEANLKKAKGDIAKEPAPLRSYAELQAESEADRDEHGRVVRDENGNPVKSKPKDRVVIASAPVNGSTCEAEKNPPQAPPAAPPAAAVPADAIDLLPWQLAVLEIHRKDPTAHPAVLVNQLGSLGLCLTGKDIKAFLVGRGAMAATKVLASC